MVTFVFGKPGSGKSYYSIRTALEMIDEGKKVYSNIRLLENVHIDNYNFINPDEMMMISAKVKELLGSGEIGELHEVVEQLHEIFEPGAFYIIDEAHLYGFGARSKNSGMLELLSIHRNVKIDLFIVTQTPRQIQPALLDNGELFIKAIPASSRKFKNMIEYRGYTDLEEYKARHGVVAFTETVRADPEIYKLYSIGDNLEGDNGKRIKMYIFISIAVILPIAALYFFYNSIGRLTGLADTADDNVSRETVNDSGDIVHGVNIKTGEKVDKSNKELNITINLVPHIITEDRRAVNFPMYKRDAASGMIFENGNNYHYVRYTEQRNIIVRK